MLLTSVLFLKRGYWNYSWWPWRHEATSVPAACEILNPPPPAVTALVGKEEEGRFRDTSDMQLQTTECQWLPGSDGGDTKLKVVINCYDALQRQTGSERARETFDSTETTEVRTYTHPLKALGDKAVIVDPKHMTPGRINRIDALILRANVVIEVSYEGRVPPGMAAEKVEKVARLTMAEITPRFRSRLFGLVEV
ncbi:hypothetical protein [Streptomyces phaeochromogenes]|uniref:hypothetical protein n=1 Tax=Streptomyces phaeochromogenes TaxID=1923 RepID=UPI0036821128